jgi:UDP-glucose 4-epimerase
VSSESRPLAWVIGKGLLGSHLQRRLPLQVAGLRCWECPVPRFAWSDPPLLADQLAEAVVAFAEAVRSGHTSWSVAWCAGAGVVGSKAAAFETERASWERLLGLLAVRLVERDRTRPGLLFLASSAGGVYGNSPGQPLTERSRCVPISAYGEQKLRLEGLLSTWARAYSHVGFLIGRIANLYGPGQNLDKPQGLISQISRCLIYHNQLNIYVNSDTIRDYIYVDDCAHGIARGLGRMARAASDQAEPPRVLKIFASEQATSIARIVGIFLRLTKQRPRLVLASRPVRGQQPPVLRFRSDVWRDLDLMPRTDLATGISQVHSHQLALYREGRLPPPEF